MFYQIFLSPQVKQSAIISNKHGMYELPHELPNNLQIYKISGKNQNLSNDSLVPNPPAKMRILLILARISWKTEIKLFPQFHMKIRISLK